SFAWFAVVPYPGQAAQPPIFRTYSPLPTLLSALQHNYKITHGSSHIRSLSPALQEKQLQDDAAAASGLGVDAQRLHILVLDVALDERLD
ncbi:hypothetical protein LTR39_004643, partial [Cryomyces antarcticus]